MAVAAAALAAAGLFTGIAQSQQPPPSQQSQQPPDDSPQKAAHKMVDDLYRAGKGRVIAQSVRHGAIWRNNQYHFVQSVQKTIIVDTPYGPASIREIGEIGTNNGGNLERQLPPVDPKLRHREPTAAETAAMEAKLNAMNAEAARAAGLPAPPPGVS